MPENIVYVRSPQTEVAVDWLSHLFEMMPVHGRLDLRSFYGAPWRIQGAPGAVGEIPYRAIVSVGPCDWRRAEIRERREPHRGWTVGAHRRCARRPGRGAVRERKKATPRTVAAR